MRMPIAVLLLAPLLAAAQQFPQFAPPAGDKYQDREKVARERKVAREYQECITKHAAEFQLHVAASQVIEVRKSRAEFERALAENPALRARWPGGYDQSLASVYEEYRKAGGKATSAEAVTEVPHPCPPPAQAAKP
jgi:hypothetical protein